MEVITGPGGPGPERGPAATLSERWHRRSARARTVAAAAAVAVPALGGTVAYAAASGGSHSGAVPAAGGSPSASASPDGPGGRHGIGPWFGLGGAGVHGEATVKDPGTGKWVVRTWQRGTVQKGDGDQVTVKSEDGAQWTWTVGSGAAVRGDGTSGSGAGALKKGDTAFLIGTRSGNGTRTALHALTGTGDDRNPGGWRGGFGGHGPRDPGTRPPTPSPPGSGATT